LRKGNITKAAEASVKRRNMRIDSWPAGRGVRSFGEASERRSWEVITEEFVGSQMGSSCDDQQGSEFVPKKNLYKFIVSGSLSLVVSNTEA
jgi:hypothetical protein